MDSLYGCRMRIRVIPSELRALTAQWRQAAFSLDEIRLQIQRAWSGLDWEVRQEVALETLVIQAQRQALTLMDEAERLGRFLDERAAAFEQADEEGVARLAQTSGAWLAAVDGTAALLPDRRASFPSTRAQGYLQLGSLVGNGNASLPAPTPVRIEQQEQRALLEFSVDEVVSKLGPLGLLKDGWDVLHLPAWNAQVQQASNKWSEALTQYGANAPLTQAAYGNYLETMIFKMPFFGTKAEAFISFLKIVGRMNPVE